MWLLQPKIKHVTIISRGSAVKSFSNRALTVGEPYGKKAEGMRDAKHREESRSISTNSLLAVAGISEECWNIITNTSRSL